MSFAIVIVMDVTINYYNYNLLSFNLLKLTDLRLFNLKTKNRRNNKSLTNLLEFLKDMFLLVTDEDVSDVLTKKPPTKLLWYNPIILRFKRYLLSS
ncbi:hypothetical protein CR513_55759, partial [Mucuna pruriens]